MPSAQRQEVPLSLKSDAVASAAAAVAASPVGSALEDLCGDAPLFDLCAVVSAPGAPIQPLHSDLGFDGAAAAPLYTCFVALQATPSALGPTEFCVGSHTDAAAHSALREGSLSRQAVPFALDVGAAVLFDPRIAHRGGPNSSNRRRAFLSMTFANPRGSAPVIVPAPGDVLVSEGGISADGGGVWTLQDLRNML
jgi:ectoine hydroxylase-related dioxygenase (phytanoyl-CoA dioxygenase family)